ncbi:CLPTM1-like membrane protein cnrB [Diplonema papillatum]|nr:CLPTM1-like membrane protein cnrB [Diplonema papillatum]
MVNLPVSTGSMATLLAVAYFVMLCNTMWPVIFPLSKLTAEQMADPLLPYWQQGAALEVRAFITTSPSVPESEAACRASDRDCLLAWKQPFQLSDGIQLTRDLFFHRPRATPARKTAGPLLRSLWARAEWRRLARKAAGRPVVRPSAGMWKKMVNKSAKAQLFVVTLISEEGAVDLRAKTVQAAATQLTANSSVPKYVTERWLLQDLGLGHFSGVPSYKAASDASIEAHTRGDKARVWKSDILARVVAAGEPLPAKERAFLPNLHPFLRVLGRNKKYLPPVYSSPVSTSLDTNGGVEVINGTTAGFPLRLSIDVSSDLSKWLLMNHFEKTKEAVKTMGIEDSEFQEIIDGFANTSLPLLTITVIATVLHCLFEFLAFKSDVSFWQENNSLCGLSFTTLIFDLLLQVLIYFYLLDEQASAVILLPGAIGLLIQIWKLRRATGLTMTSSYPFFKMTRVELEGAGSNELTRLTVETDRRVMRHTVQVLVPVALAVAGYSLVHSKHYSWVSWIIHSLAGLAYSAGFLLMTPQVIINYKLKSVAHLPWRLLTYRFINTFIDDLFALIVRMPTMHRMSVFKDDIIFIVCMVQRFLYRVDMNRKETAD